MAIPLRSYNLKYATRWPRHIIIHHTSELNINNSAISLDKATFQTDKLETSYYLKNKEIIPYNFIIEKVNNDYVAISGRPLLTTFEFDDIDLEYIKDIHIGLLGDYDINIVNERIYQVLSFKVVAPYIRLFNISEDDILLHRDISYNPDETSPGLNFNLGKFKTILRSYVKKKSISKQK